VISHRNKEQAQIQRQDAEAVNRFMENALSDKMIKPRTEVMAERGEYIMGR
jgi:hypothetical protein